MACLQGVEVTDLDRHELVLKDDPLLPLRGRVDEPLPESMRTMEVFHDAGRPDLERASLGHSNRLGGGEDAFDMHLTWLFGMRLGFILCFWSYI